MQRILLLLDLKQGEEVDQLTDIHLLRTIGAFYSSYPDSTIEVISLHELPSFAEANGLVFDDIYIIGHGQFSTLGSGLSIGECGNLFKESVNRISDKSKLDIGHIHLSVCHSAEKVKGLMGPSLLESVHSNLHSISEKPIKISGYQGQIHLVRKERFENGKFILDKAIPYASIIHEGLQPIRKLYDFGTLSSYTIHTLFDFAKFCQNQNDIIPTKQNDLFKLFCKLNQGIMELGGGETVKQAVIDLNQHDKFKKYFNKVKKFIKKLAIESNGDEIALNDEYKTMSVESLIQEMNELKKNNNGGKTLDPNRLLQLKLAWKAQIEKLEEKGLIAIGENYKNFKKQVYQEVMSYLKKAIPETVSKYLIQDHCYEAFLIAENICFKDIGIALNLKERLQFLKKLDFTVIRDKLTIMNDLKMNELLLIDDRYIFTCKTNEDFLDIEPLSPTIYWERGFWKDLILLMPGMEQAEFSRAFDYIEENFKNINDYTKIEILTELPIKIKVFLENYDNNINIIFKLRPVLSLLSEYKDIVSNLSDKALDDWMQIKTILMVKPNLNIYLDNNHINALDFIEEFYNSRKNNNQQITNTNLGNVDANIESMINLAKIENTSEIDSLKKDKNKDYNL